MNSAPRILVLFGSGVIFGQERGNVRAMQALQERGCSVFCLVREEAWARKSIDPYLIESNIEFAPAPFLQNNVAGARVSFYVFNILRFIRSYFSFTYYCKKFQPTHVHVGNPLHFLSFFTSLIGSDLVLIYRIGDKPNVHNPFWGWLWRRCWWRCCWRWSGGR